MGVSTDASIAYGIDIGEFSEFPWDDDSEEGPWDALDFAQEITSRPSGYKALGSVNREWSADEQDAHREKLNEYDRETLRQGLGFDVDTHCSGDYPMWIAYIPGTRLTAWRGYPKTVELPEIRADQILQFKIGFNEYIRPYITGEYGLYEDKPIPEPTWLLYSFWG